MKLRQLIGNTDFLSGLMFLLFGAAAVYFARDYPMGTAMRMGPGYFPVYLGILLMLIGVVIGVRGALASGERMGRWALRPLLVLGVAIIAFAWTMDTLGFIPALAVVIVGSTLAGHEFRWLEVLLLTAVLILGAVAIFIYGIELPYPLFSRP